MNVYYNSIYAYVNCVQRFDSVRVFFKHANPEHICDVKYTFICVFYITYMFGFVLEEDSNRVETLHAIDVCID